MEYTMPVRTAVNTSVAKVWVGGDLCHKQVGVSTTAGH